MGTDIHIFIEWKKGDEPWSKDSHHQKEDHGDYQSIRQVTADGRDYELFGALSGVRSEGPEPNGLPEDVTDTVLEALTQFHYHSLSHASLEEFMKKYFKIYPTEQRDLKKSKPDAFGEDYSLNYLNLFAYCLKKKRDLELDLASEMILLNQQINADVQCRLVFGYDS